MAFPVALAALQVGLLVAAGGLLPWATTPALAAAALIFLLSGAQVAPASSRALDLCILAALAWLALQLVPLPPSVVDTLSPNAGTLRARVAIEPLSGWQPLSVHPEATRSTFAWALTAVLLFWGAREALARGGTRLTVRLLGWVGFATALAAMAQRITAPDTVLWMWQPLDPAATPYGPFVDRNHLATWLIMAVAPVAGLAAAQATSDVARSAQTGWRARVLAWLHADTLALSGAAAVMVLALAVTQSRSGLMGLAAAAVAGVMLSTRGAGRHRAGTLAGVGAVVVLLALAAYTNSALLLDRIDDTLSGEGIANRVTIWRETLVIARDFLAAGVGGGSFADAMLFYQRTGTERLFNHAHNEYLHLLTEGGVVLLACLAAALTVLVRDAARRLAADGRPSPVRAAACAGLVAVAVQSAWDTGLRVPANLCLAAVLAAIVVLPPSRSRTP